MEYLLSQVDLVKDGYFEKEYKSEKEEAHAKSYLQGQLQVYSDIIGLVAFMNAFKVLKGERE